MKSDIITNITLTQARIILIILLITVLVTLGAVGEVAAQELPRDIVCNTPAADVLCGGRG